MDVSVGVFTILIIEGNIILELLSLLEHWQGGGGGRSGGDCGPPQPHERGLAAGQGTGAAERIQPCSPCSHSQHYLCDRNTEMISNATHNPMVSLSR